MRPFAAESRRASSISRRLSMSPVMGGAAAGPAALPLPLWADAAAAAARLVPSTLTLRDLLPPLARGFRGSGPAERLTLRLAGADVGASKGIPRPPLVGMASEGVGSGPYSIVSSLWRIGRPGVVLLRDRLPVVMPPGPEGPPPGASPVGAFRQAWIRFLPSGFVTSGWSLDVVKV
jgi:hypothetical protein